MSMRDLDSKILISGLSGTELLRLTLIINIFRQNNKLNLDTFLKEHVELVDILKDDIINKNEYYDHLKNFTKDLDDVDCHQDKDLSAYIDYFAFYRTHFSRYLSLANSFMPFYTPYGDYKFAKLMYETSYDLKKNLNSKTLNFEI